MKPSQVFVCECQPIVVEGLRKVIDPSPDLELTGAALSAQEALAALTRLAPDVILVSEEFGVPADAQTVAALRSASPRAGLVLWTSAPGWHEECFELGFSGILDKKSRVEALLDCLRTVAQGAVWLEGRDPAPEPVRRRCTPRLTPREREIVRLVAEGLKNREIAETLSISPGTVKVHLMHVFEKAGVEDRLQLALLSRRLLNQEPAQFGGAEAEPALQAPV